MEKFIPYEKLSKKEKRKLDQAKRQTWGNLNPVTGQPENSKAYNRNKARNCKRVISAPGLIIAFPRTVRYTPNTNNNEEVVSHFLVDLEASSYFVHHRIKSLVQVGQTMLFKWSTVQHYPASISL